MVRITVQFEDDKMEYTDDDDSYDMVSWKEFCISPTDSDKEDSSDESKSQKNESWKEFCLSSTNSDKEDSFAESKSQKNELECEASLSDDETDMVLELGMNFRTADDMSAILAGREWVAECG